MNWEELRLSLLNKFIEAGFDEPDFDIDQILLEVSGFDRAELLVNAQNPVENRFVIRSGELVERRLTGEPLQYVLGSWSFRKLDLMLDKRVLIPRPETEQVVGWAIELLTGLDISQPLIADLGTGSGAIGLSLAYELKDSTVWITDTEESTLDLARLNLTGLGLAGSRVHLSYGDWFEALPTELMSKFDLIISNPPYIANHEVLDKSVSEWEPHDALFAGEDGTEDLKLIVKGSPNWLNSNGVLVLEMAPWQVDEISKLMRNFFNNVETKYDYQGLGRSVLAHGLK